MIDVLQIPKRRVYILPLTPDENDENFRDKFIDIQRATLNYCIEHGYNFVPRLHIYMYKLFDDKMDEYHKII
jgi:DNA repair photolyase